MSRSSEDHFLMTPGTNGCQKMDSRIDQTITLLKLHPHHDIRAPIRCETFFVDIHKAPAYAALSYVWGRQTNQVAIEVNRQEHLIGWNLHSALQRIRLRDDIRVVWADQLCIDQNHKAEKQRQLQLMGEIYANCKECLAWLGEIPRYVHIEDVRWLFDAFHHIATFHNSHLTEEGEVRDAPAPRMDHEGTHKALSAFLGADVSGFDEHSWWARIWTVQEAILPERLYLLFGMESIPWSILYSAIQFLWSEGVPRDVHGFINSPHQRHLALLINTAIRMMNTRQFATNPMNIFFRWRQRNATDPRDKVYGLLGLLDRNSLPLTGKCDPEIPLRTVLINLTIDLILYQKDLSPLAYDLRLESSSSGIPGWVFNLSHNGVYVGTLSARNMYKHYSACGSRTLDLQSFRERMSCEPDILQVFGSCADRIIDVGEPMWDHYDQNIVTRWRRLGEEHFTERSAFYEDFLRILISDLVSEERQGPRKATPTDLDELREAITQDDDEGDESVAKFRRMISNNIRNRAFFVTNNRRIGLGAVDIKVGDQIWVLDGGNVPFTLRLRAQDCNTTIRVDRDDRFGMDARRGRIERSDEVGSQSEGIDFDFGGACYVHGLMDGQLINSNGNSNGNEPQRRLLRIR